MVGNASQGTETTTLPSVPTSRAMWPKVRPVTEKLILPVTYG